MSARRLLLGIIVIAAAVCPCRPATAFFHLWRFTEFFSNADGTVQFIELHTASAGENFANGAEIRSASTGKVHTLTQDLSGSTANKRLLLATGGFGALPGAVPPDFPTTPLPANFFNPAGDTITLWHHGVIDTRTFSSVPNDGVLSRVYPSNTLETNSPTNFAGQSGSVNLAMLAGDYNDNSLVDAADYVVWRKNLNTANTIPNDITPHWVMEDDYDVWRANFGRTAGAGAGILAVPEPATLFLATGLACAVACVRPMRRARPLIRSLAPRGGTSTKSTTSPLAATASAGPAIER